MGQGTQQRHQFACRSCQETIEVGLSVDYINVATEIIYGKNAVPVPPLDGTVVNLDANFLIPDKDQGKELAFPRLEQNAAMIKKWIADRRARGLSEFPDHEEAPISQRPDFAAEWNELRAAWSLRRNGKEDLSAKRVKKVSAANYASEPLTDLADWIWRFSLALGGPRYHALFEAGMEQIRQAKANEDFGRFCSAFTDEIRFEDAGHRLSCGKRWARRQATHLVHRLPPPLCRDIHAGDGLVKA